MSRKALLRIAAILALFTCLGHTVGTFMAIPAEQVAMRDTVAIMEKTLVPMPVGAARSYKAILDGNNLCVSLFLLLCGAQLWLLSSTEGSVPLMFSVALALAGIAVISAIYFFPVPAVCTGLASLLTLTALKRR